MKFQTFHGPPLVTKKKFKPKAIHDAMKPHKAIDQNSLVILDYNEV